VTLEEKPGRVRTVVEPTSDVYRVACYATLRPLLDLIRRKELGPYAEVAGSTLVEHFNFDPETVDVLERPDFDLMVYPRGLQDRYSLVFADFVLEHVPDPLRAVKHIHSILHPGGWIVLTTAFLFPVHRGGDFGDFWRFSPQALGMIFERWPDSNIGYWGSREAAEAVLRWRENAHSEETGRAILNKGPDDEFPVIVWASARKA
jgi:SAM-dependent methyltransferase